MIAMLLLSAFAQNRGNSSMSAAMDAVVEIEARISAAVRWRGATALLHKASPLSW